jgi:hypothetical protein
MSVGLGNIFLHRSVCIVLHMGLDQSPHSNSLQQMIYTDIQWEKINSIGSNIVFSSDGVLQMGTHQSCSLEPISIYSQCQVLI